MATVSAVAFAMGGRIDVGLDGVARLHAPRQTQQRGDDEDRGGHHEPALVMVTVKEGLAEAIQSEAVSVTAGAVETPEPVPPGIGGGSNAQE